VIKKLVAGTKLRQQAKQRTKLHIESEGRPAKTALKTALRRSSGHYNHREYMLEEKKRLKEYD
jgi:hypothetical protein